MKKLREFFFENHINYASINQPAEDGKKMAKSIKVPQLAEEFFNQSIEIAQKEKLNYKLESGSIVFYTVIDLPKKS